jgi:hypothetical protein
MKQYNSTQDLFKDLPDTVLLVGNGKLNKMREIIDSYEFVIRFNDFELDGYEDDNGTKVDAISVHCSDFSFPHTKVLEKNYIKYKDSSYIFTTSPKFGNSKRDILHSENETQLLSVFKPIQSNPNIRLSSGMSLILNLSLFFNKNVHLIGFDFMETGHYWDPKFSNEQFWKNMGKDTPEHNSNYERNIISKINTIKLL